MKSKNKKNSYKDLVNYLKSFNYENNKEYFNELLRIFNIYFEDVYKKEFDSIKRIDNKIINEVRDYAVLNGGKRIRPIIIFLTSYLLHSNNIKDINSSMISIELIHSYSLIHDDLPCMDNDTIRRGKPSVWYKYGEDIAVLAGDALLTDAFKNICKDDLNNKYLQSIMYSLCLSASSSKLINGQIVDIKNTLKNNFTANKILSMYEDKTGALFGSAFQIGSLLANRSENISNEFYKLGLKTGVAFQIKDDLIEFDPNIKLDKPKDSDIRNEKNTYVSKVGLDKAYKKLSSLKKDIYKLIDKLYKRKYENSLMKSFIDYVINI